YSFIQPNSMVTVTPVLKAKSSDESGEPDTSAALPGTSTPDNPTEDTVNPDKFTDIQEHWAKDFIYYAVEHNLFKGVSDTTFEPETPTTRAMLVTTLYNLAGQPNGYQTAGFSDVAAGSWYEAAVNWGYANKVIKGYGDGTFAPLKLVTREEMVTILHNYYHFVNPNLTEAEEVQGDLSQFADLSSLSSYAQQSMAWAVGSNLIHGRSNNLLCPQADSTRAEAATVLSLFLQEILLVK
ncbi:MAG: S-layer homology domain-containing protein, partial [Clostridia bacterium]|nr:S-layer homology domain-containing protein [Clostridia bacterium]